MDMFYSENLWGGSTNPKYTIGSGNSVQIAVGNSESALQPNTSPSVLEASRKVVGSPMGERVFPTGLQEMKTSPRPIGLSATPLRLSSGFSEKGTTDFMESPSPCSRSLETSLERKLSKSKSSKLSSLSMKRSHKRSYPEMKEKLGDGENYREMKSKSDAISIIGGNGNRIFDLWSRDESCGGNGGISTTPNEGRRTGSNRSSPGEESKPRHESKR
eukprot:TRINITY_DN1815_c0_g2_i5.p1 TRINITY_DN1815_c0_g2~~TRINITY_DN1815_c0_g2_i5.p1  ORF type:complete len:216 (+),score=46.77 TRINITY_DN1815_c0_g2_i5:362-1009(+)